MLDSTNLPRSWQVKTLGEVCDILDNMRKPINATEREQRLKNSAHKYAYYGATGQVGYIDDFLCDFESILLGEDGAPFLEPFKDKAYIVSGKYWVNNHAHILRAKKNLTINKFLCHFLNIVDYMPYVSGTTRLKLNQSAMKQIKIPIPPLEIQKRIVQRLDEAFYRIESGTKHLKSAKDNLTKYKQSLLKSAFNGTLTQDCPLSQCESATPSLHSKSISQSSLRGSNATEAIHKESTDSTESSLRANEMSVAIHKKEIDCHESLRDSRNDDKDLLNGKSANLPQGWTIKTLGEIAQIKGGKRLPKDTKYAETATPYPYIRVTDFENMSVDTTNLKYLTKETQQKIKNYTISKDDVYISIAGSIGKVGTIPDELDNANLTENAAKIVHSMDKKYLAFYLNSVEMQSQIAFSTKATTQPKLALYRIENLKIKIPPLETQKQIVAVLERHFTSADKVSAYIESCLTKAKQLKSSILKSAFEGKL